MDELPPELPDGTEYLEEREVLQIPVSPDAEAIPSMIILGVEAVSGRQAEDLDRLSGAINPDSLNNLFPANPREFGQPIQVTFAYEGFQVAVSGEGFVEIRE